MTDDMNKMEHVNETAENQSESIKEQIEDADDLIKMLKNLEPVEKREVRGILIGMQMAKMTGNKTA